jgi:hypothetical protein
MPIPARHARMAVHTGEFERIRAALREADPDGPLTAREIQALLTARGEAFDSPHRVATVLGRGARRGDVEVVEGQPYRYRLVG